MSAVDASAVPRANVKRQTSNVARKRRAPRYMGQTSVTPDATSGPASARRGRFDRTEAAWDARPPRVGLLEMSAEPGRLPTHYWAMPVFPAGNSGR